MIINKSAVVVTLSSIIIVLGSVATPANASQLVLCVNKSSRVVTYPSSGKCPSSSITLGVESNSMNLPKSHTTTAAIVPKSKILIPSPKTSAPTTSKADQIALVGCKTFPNAIVRLQNASGSSYNSALIAAQDASFNLVQAAGMDSKYQVLSNAQRIIIQYAQSVGWGGKGFSGDINTVRTALATFNSGCKANLSLK